MNVQVDSLIYLYSQSGPYILLFWGNAIFFEHRYQGRRLLKVQPHTYFYEHIAGDYTTEAVIPVKNGTAQSRAHYFVNGCILFYPFAL